MDGPRTMYFGPEPSGLRYFRSFSLTFFMIFTKSLIELILALPDKMITIRSTAGLIKATDVHGWKGRTMAARTAITHKASFKTFSSKSRLVSRGLFCSELPLV